jgi:hypothetical protein
VRRERDFGELVGNDLESGEDERLRRVHELLVTAGPPPTLPRTLVRPPLPRPRRWTAALALAAALVAAAFVSGYFLGDRDTDFYARRSVPMHGLGQNALASAQIRIGQRDSRGNLPLVLEVRGLKPLARSSWYELYLTKDGREVASCGTFSVGRGTTRVRLTIPYDLEHYDGWVIEASSWHGRTTPPLLST